MNLVCTKQQNKVVGKMVLGMVYVKCEQSGTMMELEVETVEQNIQNCVLLPPLIFDDQFKQECAVIHHDWDACNVNHEKLLGVCCYCFKKEVL